MIKDKSFKDLSTQFLFKIIVVGNANVGKSCILSKYTKNEYKVDYNVTIGVEFSSKHIKINDTSVKLQIWDTVLSIHFHLFLVKFIFYLFIFH